MNYCWTTIYVANMEESLDFYNRIMGLEIVSRFSPNEFSEICFLGSQETKVELIRDSNKNNIQFGTDISLGFEVNSLEDIMQIAEKEGIRIIDGPVQPSPQTRFINIADPNGLRIQFVERIK